MKESNLMRLIQIKYSEKGNRLFRNNVGMAYSREGVPIKYGLCVGSSDLIGWTKIIVTPEMVGQPLAVFTAIEVKKDTRVSYAQDQFLQTVRLHGGKAEVVRSLEDIK